MRSIQSIAIILISLLLILSGCTSGGAGSSANNQSPSDDQNDPTPLEIYSGEVASLASSFPTDYTANELYTLSLSLAAAQDTHGINPADASLTLDLHFPETKLRSLLNYLLIDGMSLADLSSLLTGSFSNPAQQITLGLDLDQEIPADSPIQVSGSPSLVIGVDGGNAYEFDAAGEYLRVPADESNDLIGESGAIELWIMPKVNKTGAGILHKGTAADWSDESYSLQYNAPGELAFIITNEEGTHTYIISKAPKLVVETWYHIVVTWNQSQVWLYVNGVDVAKKYYQDGWKSSLPANFAPMRSSDGDLMIGTQLPDSQPEYRFEGIIDKIRLYNRLLSADEVNSHYTEITEEDV